MEVLSGKENMEKDSNNLFLLDDQKATPQKRIYKWKEPTISIGYYQQEKAFCVPVVRRPTGGGALLHGWDISFSIADYREAWGGDFGKIYKNVSERLMAGFEKLGIKLEISKNKSRYNSYFCFDYPTLGELTYKGKKVVACAMRVLKNAFLVHGSININLDYQKASQILKVSQQELFQRVLSLDLLEIDEYALLQAVLKDL